jgi:hypothetical protein
MSTTQGTSKIQILTDVDQQEKRQLKRGTDSNSSFSGVGSPSSVSTPSADDQLLFGPNGRDNHLITSETIVHESGVK